MNMSNSYSENSVTSQQPSSRFRFNAVPSALDDDSDDEALQSQERFSDVPIRIPQQSLKTPTKRMSMTADLNSTPNGGREWKSFEPPTEEILTSSNNEISYSRLDTDQGYRPKISLTERFLVSFLP
jgi:hypothetical protein